MAQGAAGWRATTLDVHQRLRAARENGATAALATVVDELPEHTETGAKGVGVGGLIDAPANGVSSISRALEPLGVTADRIPFTPHRVRDRVRTARDEEEAEKE